MKALSLLVLQNITRQLGLVNGQKFAVKIQLLKVKETAWKNKMQCTTAVGFIKFFIIFVTVWQRGSGWQQHQISPVSNVRSMRSLHSIGKYPERYDKSNQAAMEHGSRMRHQSKNPEYVAKLGVNNGVKGSGNPYIDQDLSTGNETILVGKQVILRCHIEDVKGKSVSWIRHSDSGLLAVNDFVYTTSHRIKVYHENGSVDYRLSINPVELTDASLYECQVSTTPHTSHFMKITVMEPNTTILGNKELFIEAGSTINLTCIIRVGAMSDTHIFWNYNGKIIAYDRRRGGTIVIDKRELEIVTSLLISQADQSDSGEYTCDPASSYPQSIIVHVTKGSDAAMRPNAIVRSSAPRKCQNSWVFAVATILPLLLLHFFHEIIIVSKL